MLLAFGLLAAVFEAQRSGRGPSSGLAEAPGHPHRLQGEIRGVPQRATSLDRSIDGAESYAEIQAARLIERGHRRLFVSQSRIAGACSSTAMRQWDVTGSPSTKGRPGQSLSSCDIAHRSIAVTSTFVRLRSITLRNC